MGVCSLTYYHVVFVGLRGSHRDDRKSRQGPSRSGPGRPAGRAANDDRRSGKSKYDDRRNTNMDNKAKRDGKVFRMDQVHLSNPGSVQVSCRYQEI